MNRIFLSTTAAFLTLSSACGNQGSQPLDAASAKLAAQHDRAPSLDMYRLLASKKAKGNVVFSPYSALAAFSLLYPGARNETQESLAKVFRFPLDLETFLPLRQSLQQSLTERPTDLPSDAKWELNIANDIWARKGMELVPSYVSGLRTAFNATLRTLDFQSDPEGSRKEINDHIENVTKERIQELLPRGTIKPDTNMVLTNAIYFLSDWISQFDPSMTFDAGFRSDDGQEKTVKMMNQSGRFAHFAGNGYQAVSLPYVGNTMDMVVLVPTEGTVAELENKLTPKVLDDTLAGLQVKPVRLAMPKFEITSDPMSLKDTLKAMGLNAVFCDAPSTDFSGMIPGGAACVDEVLQKAFIKVDEKGTEAAAATAIIMLPTASIPEEPPTVVRVDRSSLFLIRERKSQEILFLGRLWAPEK